MALNHIYNFFGRLLIACIAVTGLMASEQRGQVMSGGLPVPGATVTVTMGDQKHVTTTDEQGVYSFPDLADGNWTLTIDMLGFTRITTEVGVAPGAPPAILEMRLLSPDMIKAEVAERLAPPKPPAAATPATPAAPAATAATASSTTPARCAKTRHAGGRHSAGGRPWKSGRTGSQRSQRASLYPAGRNQNQNGGFQRADVTQQADLGLAGGGYIDGQRGRLAGWRRHGGHGQREYRTGHAAAE